MALHPVIDIHGNRLPIWAAEQRIEELEQRIARVDYDIERVPPGMKPRLERRREALDRELDVLWGQLRPPAVDLPDGGGGYRLGPLSALTFCRQEGCGLALTRADAFEFAGLCEPHYRRASGDPALLRREQELFGDPTTERK